MGVGLTCPEKGIIVLFLASALLGLGTSLWSGRKKPTIESGQPSSREAVAAQAEPGSELRESLDVNAATESELVALRGVGPVLAKRIVEYRGENGPFICVEELLNVKGIGPRTLAEIEQGIFCGPRQANQERGFE